MKSFKIIIASLLLIAGVITPAMAKDYQCSAFGIKPDGVSMNTNAIQKAIDYISQNGGGRLVFTPGRYLTGSIFLKSDVTLHLEDGSVILGSTNPYDYDTLLKGYGLIFAYKVNNIAITGNGEIDGQGRILDNNFIDQVYAGVIKDQLRLGRVLDRPRLINFRECNNVKMLNVTLKNPGDWTFFCDQCEDIVIDGLTLNSRAYWNNDGLDIVDCSRALIQNCFVSATDDGICLKSHSSEKICQDIVVRNNRVCSSASGIKFGTLSRGGFKNIKIINNTVFDTFRSAITVQSVDGGIAENILVDSLRSINTGNPIYLVVGERTEGSSMKNVTISNVYAEVPSTKPDAGYDYEGPTEDNPRNISPSGIVGLKHSKISNVLIKNVEIVYPGGGNPYYAKLGTDELDKVPEMPKAYPEFSQHKELPAWGFYVRHVDGVVFDNVKLKALKSDYRPAIVLDDVQNGDFRKIEVDEPVKGKKNEVFVYKSSDIKK